MKTITILATILLSITACSEPDQRPTTPATEAQCKQLAKESGYRIGKVRNGVCYISGKQN